MDLNVLKTFIAVCEEAGFSAAARRLGYTQSTVSSQIRQLEEELDTVLFDRFYHRIGLTADGRLVLTYARRLLETHEQLLTALREPEEVVGEVRLAMSSSVSNRYFREDYLRFRKTFPQVRLIITESGTERMFDMLRKNEADLVFTLDSPIYDPEFEVCAERQELAHFIAAAGHSLTARDSIAPEELREYPFVLTETDMSYRKLLDTAMAAHSMSLQPVLEIGNPLQICSIVKNSELLSFLPDFIAEDYVRRGEVVCLPVTGQPVSVWTQLLIHRNKWRSPAINAFVGFYREIIEGER